MDQDYRVGLSTRLLATLTGILLLAPTLIVIPLSFTDKFSFKFPPDGWSLRFYENLFTDPEWRDALVDSFILASVVMVVSVLIGTLAAIGLTRARLRAAPALNAAFLSPIIVPGIIFAIAIYDVFLETRLVGSFLGFVIAHTIVAVPFPIITITAGLRGIDRNLERAAATQGANPFVAFTRITVPLLAPSVLAGAAFAFITSFDEIVVSLFIQSTEFRTLPVKMFTSVSTESDPTIAAAATVVIALSTLIILVAQLRGNSAKERTT